MNFANKYFSTVIFGFSFLIAVALTFAFPFQDSIFFSIVVGLFIFLTERLGGNSSLLSVLKKILAIELFVYSCFFIFCISVYFTSDDYTDRTVVDKLVVSIILVITSLLSFLVGRWLWRTAKISIPSDTMKATESVITDSVNDSIKPSTVSKSLFNILMFKRASMILGIVSGIVAVYIYFNPYKLALSELGEPVPLLGAVCAATAYFLKDPGFCRFIGTPIMNSLHKYVIEEEISFWQNWIFFLAVVFCVTLIVTFIPSKIEESSVKK